MADTPDLTTTFCAGKKKHLTMTQMRKMVEELLPTWIEKLGCPHWEIHVEYGECDEAHWAAQCERNVSYEIATIRLDPKYHYSREDVERSLIHELLHVKLAIFDLYREVVTQNRLPDTTEAREEARLWEYCIEQGVKDLRRLVFGMGGMY